MQGEVADDAVGGGHSAAEEPTNDRHRIECTDHEVGKDRLATGHRDDVLLTSTLDARGKPLTDHHHTMMLLQTPEPLARLVAEDPRHRHRRHLDDRREHSDLGRRGSHLERGEVAADHGDTRRGSQAFPQRRCVLGPSARSRCATEVVHTHDPRISMSGSFPFTLGGRRGDGNSRLQGDHRVLLNLGRTRPRPRPRAGPIHPNGDCVAAAAFLVSLPSLQRLQAEPQWRKAP